MIKEIAWNTFKNTGDINTFMEFKNLENANKIQDNITQSQILNTNVIKQVAKGNL